jgi:exo-poly-alpha-galacturonosidase
MRGVGANGTSSTAGGRACVDRGGTGNAFILTLKYSAGSNVFANAGESARYSDITVRNVSLDNVTAARGGAAIHVDGYAGTDTALTYPETFHSHVIFDRVRIEDAKPAGISRLENGRFNDVTVTVDGTPAPTSWWELLDTNPGTGFTRVSPEPPSS